MLAIAVRDVVWYKTGVLSFLESCGVPRAVMLEIRKTSAETPTIKIVHYVLDRLAELGDDGFQVARQLLTRMHYWNDFHSIPSDRKDRALASLAALRVIHPRDRPTGGAVFVGLEHVESDTGRRTGSTTVEKAALTGRKPTFRAGDIVYGYLRPYLNKVWVAEFDGLCSVDQYVFTANQKRADTNYVAWFLRSPQFLSRAPIDAAPGQLPRIRGDEIASTKIPLPSLDGQQTFVRQLSEAITAHDCLVGASESEFESLSGLPAALLHRAFGGGL